MSKYIYQQEQQTKKVMTIKQHAANRPIIMTSKISINIVATIGTNYKLGPQISSPDDASFVVGSGDILRRELF